MCTADFWKCSWEISGIIDLIGADPLLKNSKTARLNFELEQSNTNLSSILSPSSTVDVKTKVHLCVGGGTFTSVKPFHCVEKGRVK